MTDFPGSIYSPREKENRPGVVYDVDKKQVLFVEDLNKLEDEVVALEENMQDKRDRIAVIVAVSPDTLLETGDGIFYFVIPAGLDGYDIVAAHAAFNVVQDSGDSTIDIYNFTKSHSIFTSVIQIDEGDKNSYSSTSQPAINTDYDDVATGDELRIDITSEPDTAQGLQIFLTFRKPV